MSNRIFVGNIPYDATEQELREFFQKAGNITQVVIPKDRETGKPRGFAFVEFESAAQMQEAVFKLNNALLRDRKIIVSEAKKKEAGVPPRTGGRPYSPAPQAAAVSWDVEEQSSPRENKFKRGADFEESSKAKKRMMAEISEKKSRDVSKEKSGRFYSYEEDEESGGDEDFVPIYMKDPETEDKDN